MGVSPIKWWCWVASLLATLGTRPGRPSRRPSSHPRACFTALHALFRAPPFERNDDHANLRASHSTSPPTAHRMRRESFVCGSSRITMAFQDHIALRIYLWRGMRVHRQRCTAILRNVSIRGNGSWRLRAHALTCVTCESCFNELTLHVSIHREHKTWAAHFLLPDAMALESRLI